MHWLGVSFGTLQTAQGDVSVCVLINIDMYILDHLIKLVVNLRILLSGAAKTRKEVLKQKLTEPLNTAVYKV